MSEDASASCETIIRNGMVIDGGGGPRVLGAQVRALAAADRQGR